MGRFSPRIRGWMRPLYQSWRSLMLHRLRTLLSTLGVLFGVVAVLLMLAIGEGAKQETLEQISQLGLSNIILKGSDLTEEQQQIAREGRSRGLSQEDGAAIAATLPGIRRTAALRQVEAKLSALSTALNPEILATERGYLEIRGLEVGVGRGLCDEDLRRRASVCVIGEEIAHALGREGRLGSSLRIEQSSFQIVGILRRRDWRAGKNSALTTRNVNRSILIPLGSEKMITSRYEEPLSEIHVELLSGEAVPAAARAISSLLKRSHAGIEDYQVLVPQELMNQALRTQRTFNLVLGSIAAISLLVGGIGIMNIMLATVSERTREIGIRRAVGANRRHIVVQFLLETLLLTLSGAFLGVLIAIGGALFIGFLAGWKVIITLWSLILSLAMAALVGLFSGLYPAYRAAAMDPIAALRQQ